MPLTTILSFFLSTQTNSNYISLKPTNTSNIPDPPIPFSGNYSRPNDLQEKQSFGAANKERSDRPDDSRHRSRGPRKEPDCAAGMIKREEEGLGRRTGMNSPSQ